MGLSPLPEDIATIPPLIQNSVQARRTAAIDRRAFLKTAAAAGAATWLGGVLQAQAPSDRPSDKPHKILSCNIRTPLEMDEKSGDGWDARKVLCAEVIRSQQADLIGFQECYAVQLDYLKSQLPEFASFSQFIRGPIGSNLNPLNAILYSRNRYEMTSAGGFWLSKTPHIADSVSWDSARPRFANWIDLKDRTTGRAFRFWNTHLDHKGETARREQARVLAEAAGAYPVLPQILTCDLNAPAGSPPVQTLKGAGWIDSYAAVHGAGDPGFTFHAFKGAAYIAKSGEGKIDWIFCRGGARPIAANILRDGRQGRWPSDHYFLSAEVVFQPPAKKDKA
jgi:endonuclease/exonuclease/phosphatase family metal-dependent hydrolase